VAPSLQLPPRMQRVWRPALVLAVVAGCGGGEPAGPDAAGAPDAAEPDPSDELFRTDRVLEVSITMAPADFAQLRNQPEELGLPHVTCDDQPTEEPYSTFHADITVAGVTLTDVGIRKKGGFGSISTERPGLKIDVHEFVASQRIFGIKHLTLNNNHQDDSRISQCLGYGLFAAAGLPASRCTFAHVTVNGEDLGVYSNVETIKDSFLRRNFGDDSGNLYESGGDFVASGVGEFQPKNHASPPDCSDLDPVVDALAAPADQLVAELGAVVDLDQFTRYWAMEVLTDHWDGYANNRNNYFFYHDPSSDRMQFIPWGIDALFEGRERTTRPMSVSACGSMPWRLYDVPATRAMYLAALRDLIATVWDEDAILAEISRMQALLQPFEPGDLADRIQPVRDFVSTRAGVLLAELDAGEPVWPYAAGQDSCLISIGTVSATFDTTWDTLGQFPIGDGTMSGTVAAVDLASSTLNAGIGLDGGKVAMQLLSPLPDGRYAVVFVIVHDPADFVVGTQPIDLGTVAAVMMFYDPVTDTASGGGLVLPGTFTLTNAVMTPGGAVRGSLTGTVREL
jgi:hypothetical protein